MSNLRDRLKQISAEKKDAPVSKPMPCARCACRTRFVQAPLLVLQPDVLRLLGGDAFAALALKPEEILFVDTETTGLSGGAGTIAFEIGLGEILGGQMKITQLWVRDYDQEEDMLSRLNGFFTGKKAVVTFNGKTFDLPLLFSRCTLNRIDASWRDLPHLDLLHPARRLYKLRLKQCTLSHLEETVLNIHRQGDIPGAEIPALWAEYLKTHQDEKLMAVFDHNLQDVESMAYLLNALYRAHAQPAEQLHMEDLFSVGRVYDRAGDLETAEKCYIAVEGGSCQPLAGRALTRIYRRSQRTEDMLALLQGMIAHGTGGIYPYVELAKLYEHRLHDLKRALEYTDQAIMHTMNRVELEELTKRRLRLSNTIRRKE